MGSCRASLTRASSGVPNPCRIGELQLRLLFEGKELELMLYNFREAGLISKEEPCICLFCNLRAKSLQLNLAILNIVVDWQLGCGTLPSPLLLNDDYVVCWIRPLVRLRTLRCTLAFFVLVRQHPQATFAKKSRLQDNFTPLGVFVHLLCQSVHPQETFARNFFVSRITLHPQVFSCIFCASSAAPLCNFCSKVLCLQNDFAPVGVTYQIIVLGFKKIL